MESEVGKIHDGRKGSEMDGVQKCVTEMRRCDGNVTE